MTRDEFHNGLRIILSIDGHEIGNPEWYRQFADDPFKFFINGDDDTADLIWAAMEKRTPKKDGDHIIPPVRMDQSMGVAAIMVNELIGTFIGADDPEDDRKVLALTCLAMFLHQLLMPARHKDKLIGILNAIIVELKDKEGAS